MRFSIVLSALALTLAAGCGSRASAPATPTTSAEVDTSDPSFNPPGDGFVMVERPKAEEATKKTAAPGPVALPAPNHEPPRGTIHAATN